MITEKTFKEESTNTNYYDDNYSASICDARSFAFVFTYCLSFYLLFHPNIEHRFECTYFFLRSICSKVCPVDVEQYLGMQRSHRDDGTSGTGVTPRWLGSRATNRNRRLVLATLYYSLLYIIYKEIIKICVNNQK
jgi:hypothetical protein